AKPATSAAEATVPSAERSDTAVPAAPSPGTPTAEASPPPRAADDAHDDEENQQRKDDVAAGTDIGCRVALRSYALEHDVSSRPASRRTPGGTTFGPCASRATIRDTPARSPGPYAPCRNCGAMYCRLVSPA